ncbi:hypothetical protein [Caballeronia sp. 15711]|uniref:hypothetical protein n=1 Tax=Caballeronia sp. 15711 TaxID=3391029 RepID=UPI0039E67E17
MATNRANIYTTDGQRFERLVRDILKASGLKVQSVDAKNKKAPYDLKVDLDGHFILIEVKYFRTVAAIKNLVNQAAEQLADVAASNDAGAILVVSSIVDAAQKRTLLEHFGVHVADALTLRDWASRHPDESASLEQMLPLYREFAVISETAARSPTPEDVLLRTIYPTSYPELSSMLDWVATAKRVRGKPDQKNSRGSDLCEELCALPAGQADASAFEKLATRIFEYLFDEGLDWATHKPQSRTADGLHIFDLVCRVKGGTAFWDFVLKECRTRYMVFELKNYKDKIGQNQVYSTEKYLFREAFRSVAVIFSKEGPDKHAVDATAGAMRDAEKLLIHVDKTDVCEMLNIRDRNGDPSDYLFALVDKFLMGLSR